MATAVRKRHEQPTEHTWSIHDLYATDDAWEADFKRLQNMIPQLEALADTLGDDAESLLHGLQARDEAQELLQRLQIYALRRQDEDTGNAHYQRLADRVATLGSRVNAALAFADPEILGIPDEKLDGWLEQVEPLQVYRHAFNELRRQREHRRSTEVETLLAAAREVTRSPDAIYSMLNDADLKFPVIKDEAGNDVELTKGRYLRFLESPDREVRKNAFEAMFSAYAKFRNTFASTLSAQIRANIFHARARGYQSAVEASLHPDAIPLTVYTNLVDTINRNLDHLHRYMRLRKRMLQLPDLHLYDLYAPLIASAEGSYSYDQARELVVAGAKPLGEEYGAILRRGLYDERWVDVYENEGKRSGAYHSSAYRTHPFVLMNYEDNLYNVYTLAHEFGHALHSFMTRRTQPFVYGKYTTFVAEVASTLNEALLSDHLLKTSDDPMLRLTVLNRQVETLRTTMYRQVQFAEFEYETHRRTEAGEAMTADSFGVLSDDLNRRYYGPDVVIDEGSSLEWARIPHYYMNFYVYKYATGIAASTALAQQILSEGQGAVARYLTFLSGGSSQTSIDLLRGAGVDMTTPEPVQQACDVFGELVTQMEQLADEIERDRRD
jgi:oligoendopeptidase F